MPLRLGFRHPERHDGVWNGRKRVLRTLVLIPIVLILSSFAHFGSVPRPNHPTPPHQTERTAEPCARRELYAPSWGWESLPWSWGRREPMLGIRPWWKRPPWRWKDPMGTPRWKRGLGLPEMGVVRPHHDFPFWALYIKLLSLPVNAVFYSTRMMADIPRAVWKRFVSLQRGTVVKVVDWGLAK
eukprot:1339710-Amorphochlora_amoeboformis.AAC.1